MWSSPLPRVASRTAPLAFYSRFGRDVVRPSERPSCVHGTLSPFAVWALISYGDCVPVALVASDETLWLPNKEMTKPCEVSDETSTNLFPHF